MKQIFNPNKDFIPPSLQPKSVINDINHIIKDLEVIKTQPNDTPIINNVNMVNTVNVSSVPQVVTVKKYNIEPVDVKTKLESIFNTVENSVQIAVNSYDGNPNAARGLADIIKAVQGLLSAINDIDDPEDKYLDIVEKVLIVVQKNFMKALTDRIYKAYQEINITMPIASSTIRPILDMILLDVSKQVMTDFEQSLLRLQNIMRIKK